MKTVVKVLLGGFALVGLGVVAWLAAPLFYDTQVSEGLPGEEGGLNSVGNLDMEAGESSSAQPPEFRDVEILASGQFSGFDSLHQAAGTAQIIGVDGKTYVRFEQDFMVTNGPDLYVYLGSNGEYDKNANLGRLKGNQGSQNYEISSDIDLSQYTEVWVWCRAFSVPFGKVVLQ